MTTLESIPLWVRIPRSDHRPDLVAGSNSTFDVTNLCPVTHHVNFNPKICEPFGYHGISLYPGGQNHRIGSDALLIGAPPPVDMIFVDGQQTCFGFENHSERPSLVEGPPPPRVGHLDAKVVGFFEDGDLAAAFSQEMG